MKQSDGMNNLGMLLARILIAVIFIIAGYGKISNFQGTLGYMASKGIPFTEIALVLTIIFELGGGLMVFVGWKTRIGALMLFLFVIPVTFVFHAFWTFPAAETVSQMNNFLKNLAILGGLLYVFIHGAGKYSFDRK